MGFSDKIKQAEGKNEKQPGPGPGGSRAAGSGPDPARPFARFGQAEPPPEGSLELREGSARFHEFIARATLDMPEEQRTSHEGHSHAHSHDHDHDHEHGPGCGDPLAHGFMHVCELLSFDPSRAEWLELMERYLAEAGGDLARVLPEDGDDRYFATEAVRALLLARAGHLTDAVGLLTQVQHAKSDAPYLEAWAPDWLEPAGALEGLPPSLALQLLTQGLVALPEAAALEVRREANAQRLARLARRLPLEGLPPELVTTADMTLIGLHRKAGLFAEGLELARQRIAARPSWHAQVGEGLLLREQGEAEAALVAFRKALEHNPSDLTALLEAGDMFFEREEWARAGELYAEVLAREPAHEWAEPSALWCQWRTRSDSPFPDDAFPSALLDLAHAGNGRARMLFGHFHPYEGFLPQPRDATANVISQILAEGQELAGEVKLTLSNVEAPSNALAFAQVAQLAGYDATLVVSYEHVADPDPREPLSELAYPLWRREGEVLVPALDPPAEPVAQAVSELARAPWKRERDWAAAGRLARELGPGAVRDVLACVVHPPLARAPEVVLGWIPRMQMVAAQVLAQLDSGWAGSVRRDALLSLLLGPRDWATEAAILALTDLVQREPAHSLEVGEAFERLAAARPDSGFVAYEEALFSQWLGLPHLWDEERAELVQILESLEQDAG